MKTKKILALILALCTILSLSIIPVGATEEHNHDEIEVIVLNEDISEEAKEKIIAYYMNGEHEHESTDDDAATYGIICSVLGHKIETSTTYTITHKARTTAPRCLKKTYNHEVCTRCDDYNKSTFVSSTYIYCCA